ncbi:hypothetical protein CJU89_0477 [Yarrowia sp. B02]|nr:hypothetical protein CJU89_0477 [Yarrowia sp. B02]
MADDELSVDYLSECLLLVGLLSCAKNEKLTKQKAKKVIRKMQPTLAGVEMCMSFVDIPETVREAMTHAYMQRLLGVRMLMAVFADSDLGIPPPEASSHTDADREKMTMPEVAKPVSSDEMPNPMYESLKNTTLLLLASYLRRTRQETHKHTVGLAAFVIHFLTLLAYNEMEQPNSLKAIRHMFSFLSYSIPGAAMSDLKRELRLLQTAHIVEEADLPKYLETTTPTFCHSVRAFVTTVSDSLPQSYLQRNIDPVMSRSADRMIQ